MNWVELVMSLQCNCHCAVCPGALQPPGPAMDRRAIFDHLAWARAQRATGVWFGGGEPSLHPELIPAITRAVELGYDEIRLQTNGLRLAYPNFAQRCVQAGLGQVGLSVKGASAESHDRLTRTPGSFDLLQQAAVHLIRLGVQVEAEVLITRASLTELEACVAGFGSLGVERFTFWLVSLHGLPASAAAVLPSLAELRPHLQAALDLAERSGFQASSLHTPPCSLEPPHRSAYKHSGTWGLEVVLPDGSHFEAEQSPMEGGQYPAVCGECSFRPECLGLRLDYLQVHGTAGLEPL